MMYAVDVYSYSNGSVEDHISTEYFETREAAISRAQELEAEDLRITVLETTGESGDEGNVIFDC